MVALPASCGVVGMTCKSSSWQGRCVDEFYLAENKELGTLAADHVASAGLPQQQDTTIMSCTKSSNNILQQESQPDSHACRELHAVTHAE